MNTKKYFKITTSIVGTFVIVLALVIFFMSDGVYAPETPIPDNVGDVSTQSVISHYMVKATGSIVTVYEIYQNGDTKVNQTLDIDMSMLRKEDKKSIERGIKLDTYADLVSFIEDFTS